MGAPAVVHGPDRIGTSLSPARDDPGVKETTTLPGTGEGDNNAVYPGGTWYEPDGWLTWAYTNSRRQGAGRPFTGLRRVRPIDAGDPRRRLSEPMGGHHLGRRHVLVVLLERPGRCGGVLGITSYEGQNTEQPEWMVMDALNLAGVTPTLSGFRISPHFPFAGLLGAVPDHRGERRCQPAFGLRPPVASGHLVLQVAVPQGAAEVTPRWTVPLSERRCPAVGPTSGCRPWPTGRSTGRSTGGRPRRRGELVAATGPNGIPGQRLALCAKSAPGGQGWTIPTNWIRLRARAPHRAAANPGPARRTA